MLQQHIGCTFQKRFYVCQINVDYQLFHLFVVGTAAELLVCIVGFYSYRMVANNMDP